MITMQLATGRQDKGITENYRVYEPVPARTVVVKNRNGEAVTKNAILGGNGTIYVAHELAKDEKEFILISGSEFAVLKSAYDRQTQTKQASKPTTITGRTPTKPNLQNLSPGETPLSKNIKNRMSAIPTERASAAAEASPRKPQQRRKS